MRNLSLVCLLVLSLLSLSAVSAVRADGPYPAPGSNIPGPFIVYNATGKYKGRFHCLVSQYGLNPVVMVIVRGAEVKEEGFKNLLVWIDRKVEKNPITRLASFAVFLPDKINDLGRDDDEREKVETKLEDFKKDAKLQHLPLTLALPKQMEAWKLDPDKDVTVILYKEYRTVAVHNLTWEELKPPADKSSDLSAKAKAIIGEIAEKFRATR
jgi:hypothetical protein